MVLFSLRSFSDPSISTGNDGEIPGIIQLCCFMDKQSKLQRGEWISPKVTQKAAVL